MIRRMYRHPRDPKVIVVDWVKDGVTTGTQNYRSDGSMAWLPPGVISRCRIRVNPERGEL